MAAGENSLRELPRKTIKKMRKFPSCIQIYEQGKKGRRKRKANFNYRFENTLLVSTYMHRDMYACTYVRSWRRQRGGCMHEEGGVNRNSIYKTTTIRLRECVCLSVVQAGYVVSYACKYCNKTDGQKSAYLLQEGMNARTTVSSYKTSPGKTGKGEKGISHLFSFS